MGLLKGFGGRDAVDLDEALPKQTAFDWIRRHERSAAEEFRAAIRSTSTNAAFTHFIEGLKHRGAAIGFGEAGALTRADTSDADRTLYFDVDDLAREIENRLRDALRRAS
jgi:hypothetical protein